MMFKPDKTTADPNHWLKLATQEEIFEHCMKEVEVLDPKFREIIQLTGPEGLKGMVVSRPLAFRSSYATLTSTRLLLRYSGKPSCAEPPPAGEWC